MYVSQVGKENKVNIIIGSTENTEPNLKFYRAEIQSTGSDSYLSEYQEITLTHVSGEEVTGVFMHTYTDERVESGKTYRYDAKMQYQENPNDATVEIDVLSLVHDVEIETN